MNGVVVYADGEDRNSYPGFKPFRIAFPPTGWLCFFRELHGPPLPTFDPD
jgi:hypothetical protein